MEECNNLHKIIMHEYIGASKAKTLCMLQESLSQLIILINILNSIIKVLWSEISKEMFVALMTRTDKDGNTPLHLCCKYGHTAVVQEILAILKVDEVLENANRSDQTAFMHDVSYAH